ncbi:MAG: 2-dehydropantoate 2-reductase N-terminal domain-containing protein [Candidatus Sulfotelmatobacter sp.]
MASDDARILVIGAGVNGSVCSARLFERGVDVTVLARGKRFAEIESNGIVIENPFSRKRTVTKVRVTRELAPADTYEYILVVVRRNQMAELLPTLAANSSLNIVFMNNNLNGPAEIIAALGTQRPMLGFVFAGGKRDGEIIRAIGPFDHSLMTTPFGEINGTVTPRLKRLVNLLNRTGLRAKVSTHIVDYLATHAAGVAALVPLVMKHGNDIKALARSPDDLKLAAAAMSATIPVLKALGHKIVPAGQQILAVTPAFVLAFLLRLLCNSKFGEVGAAWHVQQAPDEMQALADDLRAAVIRSGVPAPAIRKVLDMK